MKGDGVELHHVREEGAEGLDSGGVGSRSFGGGDGVRSEETVGEDKDTRGVMGAGVGEEELVEAETDRHELAQVVRAESQGRSQVHHSESPGGEEAGACPGRARVRRRRAVGITNQGVRVSGVDNKVMRDDGVIQGGPRLARDRGLDAGKDGGGELGDAVTAPRVRALTKGTQGGSAVAPNGKVEGEEEGGERGGDVDEKGAGEREGEEVEVLSESEGTESDQSIKSVVGSEEGDPRAEDDTAGGVEVNKGIFTRSAEKTTRDFSNRKLVLMAHAAGSG